MLKKITYLLLFSLLLISSLNAQSIKGKIIDSDNAEILIGATVKVSGTNYGALTDMDGFYSIEGIPGGIYTIKVSYIGYSEKIIRDVTVTPGKVTRLDIVMKIDGLTTEEIVVEGNISLANEEALLVEQKNSNRITDGISEQQIKRAPDAAASDVLKRVTSLSVVKDKFVFVRGTSERYNNTTLNGSLIPSTEPDKKSFSFDIFPSNLLENVIISKTFTPDQPGNFSGGLVQITTKEFPDAFTFNLSLSGSVNSNTTGAGFMTYSAGEKKLLFFNLGIDDGGRNLPSVIPSIQVKNSNFTKSELNTFGQSFRNNWKPETRKAPANSNFQISIGNVFNFGKIPVAVLGAYSYRSGFSNSKIERNLYNTDYTELISYNGKASEFSTLWGGLVNINTKLNEYNKISLKSTFTYNSDDVTEYNEGLYNEVYTAEKRLYLTRFTERNLMSFQLIGNHYLFNKLSVDWKANYSESLRKEPDVKTMTYQRDYETDDPFYAGLNYNVGNDFAGGRFFSNLKDINRGLSLDIETPFKSVPLVSKLFQESSSAAKVKLGFFLNGTDRNFDARNFGPALYIGAPFTILFQPIEKIFDQSNFNDKGLFYDEITKESDKYSADDNLYAGYLMFDIPVYKFRLILGSRFEYSEQNVNTLGLTGDKITNNLISKDLLPSINIIYQLNDKTNIRAAYSQTLARPELREIAPFSYVDFVTGITIYGNSIDLRRTLVRNYDLRCELYPAAGELLSLSLFYKRFDAPIEDVYIPTSTNRIKTFKNAQNGADNYGIEFEIRKNLGFVSDFLKNLTFNGNLTFVSSKINLEGIGTVATKTERRMQGQSPYMINLGLFYDNPELGLNINLVYNRFGDRISEVGLAGFEDIYEKGNDVIDFSLSKTIFYNLEIRFAIKDLLNEDKIYTQSVNNIERTVRKISGGLNYSFGISYRY